MSGKITNYTNVDTKKTGSYTVTIGSKVKQRGDDGYDEDYDLRTNPDKLDARYTIKSVDSDADFSTARPSWSGQLAVSEATGLIRRGVSTSTGDFEDLRTRYSGITPVRSLYNPIHQPILHKFTFDGTAGEDDWNDHTSNCTFETDTEFVRSGKNSVQSLKVTRGSSATASWFQQNLSAPVDCTNGLAVLEFYVHPGTEGQNDYFLPESGSWSIALYISDGSSFTNFWNHTVWQSGVANNCYIPGWHRVYLVPSKKSATGTDPRPTLQTVRIRFDGSDASITPSVTFDSLTFYAAQPKPTLEIHWDDCFDDSFEAACYMHARGLTGTFAVVPNNVGNTGICTLSQLKIMRDMGHLIVNHCYSIGDKASFEAASTQEVKDEIRRAADWMVDNGFYEGANYFVVPGGGRRQDEEEIYADLDYVRFVNRTQPAGTSTYPVHDPKFAHCTSVNDTVVGGSSTQYANIKSENSHAVMIWHLLNSSGHPTSEDFKSFLDTVASDKSSNLVNVHTVRDRFLGVDNW